MLQETLKKMAEQSAAKIPAQAKAVVQQTTQAVAESIATRKIPKIGEALPAFQLPDSQGNMVDSSSLIGSGELVITFFRGGWWPYCNVELEALNAIVGPLKEHNSTLVAISPQLPELNRQLIEKFKLDFEILHDKDNAYGKTLDIAHGFNDALKKIYGSFGIDVGKANGNGVWELSIPGRVVVGAGHVVKSLEFNANYTERPEPETTLAIVTG